MGWRFSFLTEPDGKPDWFAGDSFLAANALLHSSGLGELLGDRESALVAADQIEENGHSVEANAIRAFLDAGGPLKLLKEASSVSKPS